MKILADENVDSAIVTWLREKGHDVLWAAEDLVSALDPVILQVADETSRVVLTRDLDFGELVYRDRLVTAGVILLRIAARDQWDRLKVLQDWWQEVEAKAPGHFLVVSSQRVRVRRLV